MRKSSNGPNLKESLQKLSEDREKAWMETFPWQGVAFREPVAGANRSDIA